MDVQSLLCVATSLFWESNQALFLQRGSLEALRSTSRESCTGFLIPGASVLGWPELHSGPHQEAGPTQRQSLVSYGHFFLLTQSGIALILWRGSPETFCTLHTPEQQADVISRIFFSQLWDSLYEKKKNYSMSKVPANTRSIAQSLPAELSEERMDRDLMCVLGVHSI